MAEGIQNTSNAKTNSFNKGMNKDNTDIYMSEGLWYNAINAINNSHYGEMNLQTDFVLKHHIQLLDTHS
jgi:hypothetical protein